MGLHIGWRSTIWWYGDMELNAVKTMEMVVDLWKSIAPAASSTLCYCRNSFRFLGTIIPSSGSWKSAFWLKTVPLTSAWRKMVLLTHSSCALVKPTLENATSIYIYIYGLRCSDSVEAETNLHTHIYGPSWYDWVEAQTNLHIRGSACIKWSKWRVGGP